MRFGPWLMAMAAILGAACGPQGSGEQEPGIEGRMLIVAAEGMVEAAQDYADFRREAGYEVSLVSTSEIQAAQSTVLIDQSQINILSGAIYAVGVEDTIMVKRVEKHPNALVLLSDNKDYAPIYLKDQEAAGIRMIGKVIWICRELK